MPTLKRGKDDCSESDKKMATEFYVCFDRPAFRQNFKHESDLDALMAALDDTIAAINTGVKKRRDGIIFGNKVKGKAYFEDQYLRKAFDKIVDLLSEAKTCYAEARQAGYFFEGRFGLAFHHDHSKEAIRVAVKIDELRNKALEIANEVYVNMGMAPFPYIETPPHYLNRVSLCPRCKNHIQEDWILCEICGFNLK